MGCNCKSGKEIKLNNLKSKDHLQIAFDAYESVKDKDISQLDQLDAAMVIQAFYSVYPNASGDITPQHAFNVIKHVYQENYGK